MNIPPPPRTRLARGPTCARTRSDQPQPAAPETARRTDAADGRADRQPTPDRRAGAERRPDPAEARRRSRARGRDGAAPSRSTAGAGRGAERLCRSRACPRIQRAVAGEGLPPADPDPGAGDPVRADGPRRARLRADRHRQDRRLRAADAGHPVRQPRPRAHAAQPDPGADPRAGAAGRRELRPIRQVPEADPRAADRRREPVRPEGGADARASTC